MQIGDIALGERGERSNGVKILYFVISAVGISLVVFSLLVVSIDWVKFWLPTVLGHHKANLNEICSQLPSIEPPSASLGFLNSSELLLTAEYRKRSAELLGGAVRIPTESFDDMDEDPKNEPRFTVFSELHDYLEKKFPLISSHLEYINTYGLLYTVKGSSNEKPIVLMAHQDVVPVERNTLDKWTHGAFSGFYDGDRVWGRGALDTKSSLVAILEATESLLEQNWKPERTVLISFGFDEELDGSRGALALANEIRRRYGEKNSVHMIVDEGTSLMTVNGSVFAFVGVSEKGYTDINVEVNTPGGHSSIPPDHTGIGIASDFVVRLEDLHLKENTYRLTQEDLVAQTYACIARYANDLTQEDRQRLLDVSKLRDYLSGDRSLRSLISTTQAVDVIDGGVKVNALPEQVTVTVNYRIDVHETVADVTRRVRELAEAVAQTYGLGVVLNGEVIFEETDHGYINVFNGQSLETAPVSPYNNGSDAWRLLVGTTRHVLEDSFGIDAIVSPVLVGGNTDTWRYHGISENIYRYTVGLPDGGANAHTVDEYISVDSHLAAVVWYYEMLQFF